METAYQPMPAPAARRAAPPPARRSSTKPIAPAVILLYLLLIPQQFNPTVVGLYLSPYRVFLLVASPYLMASFLRRSLPFTWPDLLVILGMIWIFFASYMSSNGSVETALIQGLSHSVDIGLAYFLARMAIQTPRDMRMFLILAAPGIAFTGLIVLLESWSHTLIVQSLASSVTGLPGPARVDVRLGFMRGMSSFPHPILAGIFLASFLPLYLLAGLRGWPRLIALAGSVFGAFTMSSAALLGLVVGGILSVYDWLTERITNLSWRIFLLFTGALYVGIELTSNTGFYGLLVRYASLNSASAYNRILIWNYGTENIARHPWFGIGYANWDRPWWMHSDSFDWFWLILALRFGILEALLLLGATIIAIAVLALRSRSLPPSDARLLRGVAISLSVFALGLNSVSLWMSSLAWFAMLLGIAVSLGSTVQYPAAGRPRGRVSPQARYAPARPNWR